MELMHILSYIIAQYRIRCWQDVASKYQGKISDIQFSFCYMIHYPFCIMFCDMIMLIARKNEVVIKKVIK
jgi:hypothetical protein